MIEEAVLRLYRESQFDCEFFHSIKVELDNVNVKNITNTLEPLYHNHTNRLSRDCVTSNRRRINADLGLFDNNPRDSFEKEVVPRPIDEHNNAVINDDLDC